MKIEKINDNQIRCTLTRDDLMKRELKISELAYGSEKAKSLFHDMMRQAEDEVGFAADDMPLMIEAIPTSPDSIVLIITKVDDPDELDTRFSKFSPSQEGASSKKSVSILDSLKKLEGADDFLNLLRGPQEAAEAPADTKNEQQAEPAGTVSDSIRFFSFASMDSAIRAAHLLKDSYNGANTLYKDAANEVYILALTRGGLEQADFNKICNMLSEFGSSEPSSGASLAYLEEHCDKVVTSEAIQILGAL